MNGDSERLVYRPQAETGMRALQFSPDRKWLAFQQETSIGTDTLTMRMMIVDVRTGESRELLEKTINSHDTLHGMLLRSWSPNGDLLVWRPGTGEALPDWLIVPVNGGAPRAMSIPSFGAGAPSGPADRRRPFEAKWSPTGPSMVIARESRSYRMFVVEDPLAGHAR
jgi:hypothetical protein